MTPSNADASRQTILLFHRLELTDLFVDVGRALGDDLRVLHLAYGKDEARQLAELGVSEPVHVFKDAVRAIHGEVQPTPALMEEIDAMIVAETGGAFNLNSAIQSDRGFTLLSYDEALRLTAVYYRFWSDFLEENTIDYVLHEPCTLMFNFIAAVLLSRRGGGYLYNIMTPGQAGTLSHLTMRGFDFTCPDLDHALASVADGALAVDPDRCAEFLREFRTNYDVFLGGTVKATASLTGLAISAVWSMVRNVLMRGRFDRVLDNVDYWQNRQNPSLARFKNLLRYRREVRFDRFDPKQPYFFYPLHLEPEAVILYHGHGIYKNQVKLVQNIAGQLPPGVLLYVKDHPHDFGYRAPEDFRALNETPNIRLLDNSHSGKEIIRHALGVITVTGTAGFEALLLGKQVYVFGKTFYAHDRRVSYIRHIRDLRSALYSRRGEFLADDRELFPYMTAYFSALKPGLTDFFAGRARSYGIDLVENAKRVAQGIAASIKDMDDGGGRPLPE